MPDQETEPLSFYKNEFFSAEDKLWFRLPCPHYDGRCCPIYDSRFAVCRTYRCKLLKLYESGEVPLADARETISTAKSLVAEVTAYDPEARTRMPRLVRRAELEQAIASNQGDRPKLAKRLLNMVALDQFLFRHFHEPTRKPEAPDAAE